MSTEAGLPAFTEYMAANPMATYWSTWQAASAINQTELAALREELATAKRNEHNSEVALKAAYEKQEELRALLAASVVERQPGAWRGINCYDEIVTDWIDGIPGPMTDLCGRPASYYRIEYAYLSPPSLEVELPTVCASDSPHELKRDIIEILEAAGIKVKK